MNERIRKLRKVLSLTQREFAERIGMKSNTIATYEMGRATPSDPTINNICKEYGVNERWLRTGEGEMFAQACNKELDALVSKYHLSRGAYILIEKFLDLKPEIQQAFVDYAIKVAEALTAGDSPESLLSSPYHLDIDMEVASYQSELELQEKVEVESSASDGRSVTRGTKMA